MVVGLVEQEQVRVGQQAARQPHQLALTAAEQLHRLLPLRFGHTHVAQQGFGAAVQARAAQLVELLQQVLVLGQHAPERIHIARDLGLAHARFQRGDACLQPGQVVARGQQLGQHAAARFAAIFLRQVGHARAAPQRHRAGLGRFQPGQRAQQRRFAHAIRPDQPDPLAILNRPAQLFENRAPAMHARDGVDVRNNHNGLLYSWPGKSGCRQ